MSYVPCQVFFPMISFKECFIKPQDCSVRFMVGSYLHLITHEQNFPSFHQLTTWSCISVYQSKMCFQITHVIQGNKPRVVCPILDNCKRGNWHLFFGFCFSRWQRNEGKAVIMATTAELCSHLQKCRHTPWSAVPTCRFRAADPGWQVTTGVNSIEYGQKS